MEIQPIHRLDQLRLQVGHAIVERLDVLLTKQSQAGLGVRQRHAAPVALDLAAGAAHGLEGGMGRIEKLLGGGEVLAFSAKRFGGLGLLLGIERLSDAQPGEGHPRSREARLQATCRRDG